VVSRLRRFPTRDNATNNPMFFLTAFQIFLFSKLPTDVESSEITETLKKYLNITLGLLRLFLLPYFME